MFKKIIISSLCIAIFALYFQNSEKTVENALIVGLQSGYPPFEYMDAEGKIVGFDVDLAKLIAGALKKNLVIKDMDFEGEILSLKQGKIDLIMSGMNITPSRQKEIALVPYHGEAADSLSLIFWNTIPEGVQTIEDVAKLPEPVIAVESGTIPEMFMARFKNIQTKSLQSALAPLMDVKFGKSAANLVEPDVAEYLQTQHPQIKIISVPLPEEEMILGFGIGIKKDNHELIQDVEKIIDGLKKSGELKKLENHWFKGEK